MSLTAIGPADVVLSTGERLPADLVVAAIGVRPGLRRLFADAGLTVNDRGGIVVDDHQRDTSDEHIFAGQGNGSEGRRRLGQGPRWSRSRRPRTATDASSPT